MNINFKDFIDDYNNFLNETKTTLLDDFSMSNIQCDVFLTNNKISLKKEWIQGKTVKESISNIITESGTNDSIKIAINDIDKPFIDNFISKISFVYRKRKDRYLRPSKIVGSMVDDITLRIELNNKDVIKISYKGDDLMIYINSNLVYYMDGIKKDKIIDKTISLYKKHIQDQNYVISSKSNPFM